jgi:hypothetical protein
MRTSAEPADIGMVEQDLQEHVAQLGFALVDGFGAARLDLKRERQDDHRRDPPVLHDRHHELIVQLDIVRAGSVAFGMCFPGRLAFGFGPCRMVSGAFGMHLRPSLGPQEQPGAGTGGKPDKAENGGKQEATHGQNGSTMSATCWP